MVSSCRQVSTLPCSLICCFTSSSISDSSSDSTTLFVFILLKILTLVKESRICSSFASFFARRSLRCWISAVWLYWLFCKLLISSLCLDIFFCISSLGADTMPLRICWCFWTGSDSEGTYSSSEPDCWFTMSGLMTI